MGGKFCDSCGLHNKHKEDFYSANKLDRYVTTLCTSTISLILNFGDL